MLVEFALATTPVVLIVLARQMVENNWMHVGYVAATVVFVGIALLQSPP
jgi:hypothetical protein